MGSLAKQLSGQGQQKVFKKGGSVHDDAAQDKKLIKAELVKAMSKSYPQGATITPRKKMLANGGVVGHTANVKMKCK